MYQADIPLNLRFLIWKMELKMEPKKYPPALRAGVLRDGRGTGGDDWASWPPRLPNSPLRSSHPAQGMVLSAEYIKKKLEQEMVLSQAFGRDLVSFPRHPILG